MAEAIEWIVALLTGTMATIVAILAVAIVGISFLWGRVHLSQAFRVVIGCFIIFGAGLLASGLGSLGAGSGDTAEPLAASQPPVFRAPEVIEGAYQPYPGAAVPEVGSREQDILSRAE